MECPQYPGAHPPERAYDFDSAGCRLRVHEWGDPAARPLVVCHGLSDHAHGFDLLAPLLASRCRVVALDARGHGDSVWLDSYDWAHDVTDVVRLLQRLGAADLLGHSKGGAVATTAACYSPECVRKLINIDGFGPPPGAAPGTERNTPEALREFVRMRQALRTRSDWPPSAELGQLVERRKRQNPRLSEAWLRYFCWHGSRQDEAGYRWKVDPLSLLSAGPWPFEWVPRSWSRLRARLLAVTGADPDTWGTLEPELLRARLAHVPQLEQVQIADAGHFPHVEQPSVTAALLLDYLRD
jgi:pimeloyl-ACP methyl ester carboxylesterase